MKRMLFVVAMMALNLNACAGTMSNTARNESAGYLGCPPRDIKISDQDVWGRNYRASCHGREMICSHTGAANHRQVHCADALTGGAR